MMTFLTRAYLVALGIMALRVSWVLGRARIALSRARLELIRQTVTTKISTQLFGIDQVLGLFRHLFGMVLALAVFGAFRGVELSRETGLSEIHLDLALQPLVWLSFGVFGVFVVLHVLTWIVKSRARTMSVPD
jgi:hypothetical protein